MGAPSIDPEKEDPDHSRRAGKPRDRRESPPFKAGWSQVTDTVTIGYPEAPLGSGGAWTAVWV